jgi:hypothetical protein
MIQIGLDHADSCLELQTPKEYTQQLAAASEALTRAKVVERKGGASEARGVLEDLRELLNPPAGAEADEVEA